MRAYPRLPEVDIEGRELDVRMVDDELRREEQALIGRAREIDGAIGVRPRIEIAVGDPAAVLFLPRSRCGYSLTALLRSLLPCL